MVGHMLWRQLVVLLVALSLCVHADAQALPEFTGMVNKVIGKVIQQTGLRRGFAANDPRMAVTMAGASSVAASVAAEVAMSAATAASAPVWLSVAAGLGAAAVVGGLAYGAYKLFFDDSSSQAGFYVQKSSSGTATTAPSGTVVSAPSQTGVFTGMPDPRGYNQPTYAAGGVKVDSKGAVVNSTGNSYEAAGQWGNPDRIGTLYVGSHVYYYRGYAIYCGTVAQCEDVIAYVNKSIWGLTPTFEASLLSNGQVSVSVLPNMYLVMLDLTPNIYYGGSSQTVKGTISDIVAGMDSTELAKPADPTTVAFVANSLWQRAASQSGYQGLPYSASDPVTAADAAAVQSADPSSWPKNSDLVAPVAQSAGQTVPIGDTSTVTDPGTSTGIGTNVNVVNNPGVNVLNTPNVHIDGAVDVNVGSAPSVLDPSLESTPTAQQIIGPITSLMSGLRTFVVPSHSSECPMPTFDLFGNSIVMDTQCKVLEPVRPTLYAVMAFVWVVVGTFIVLRA